MAAHSSVLAWRTRGTEEPGGLPSMGSHRVGHDWSDLAAAAAHASKVMLKIRQARLQQYVNRELPDVQAGFWKDRGTRDCQHSLDHTGSKGIPEGCLLLLHWHTKAFDCVDQNKLKNSWRDGNTRPLYLPPEKPVCRSKATIRTGHGTMGWFQIGKGVHQGCILSPCLFNLYAEYITWNARLDETQAGIKIARRNINNLRYADDTTLMAESDELKSFLLKVKEESEKVGLKLNIQKTKIMASEPITSWQINGEKMKTVMDFIFLGSKITADDDCSHKIKRYSLLGRRAVRSISSVAQLCLALWELVDGGMSGFLSFTISQSLLKLMSPELVMPSNHLILCHPCLLLPSIFPASGSFPLSWLFASGG